MLDLEPGKLNDSLLAKKKSNGKIIITGSNCILMKKRKTNEEEKARQSLTTNQAPSLNSTPMSSVLWQEINWDPVKTPQMSSDAMNIWN